MVTIRLRKENLVEMKNIIFLGLIIVSFVLVGCAADKTEESSIPQNTIMPQTPDVSQGEALVSSRCAECHDLIRVTSARYDQDGWEKTIERMITKGAQLSAEEKILVLNYLTITFPKE
jgi:hypothetical protein